MWLLQYSLKFKNLLVVDTVAFSAVPKDLEHDQEILMFI